MWSWSQSSFSHLAPHSFIRSFIFHSDFNNVYYMSTFVRIHSMKYVQVMMMIQENEPGTATFMEDSARDDGTVISVAVIPSACQSHFVTIINLPGIGKRAWNSHFSGGLGKRAWNNNFSGESKVLIVITAMISLSSRRFWKKGLEQQFFRRTWKKGLEQRLHR